MMKITFAVIVALIALAYFNNPNSFTSWGEVTGHISEAAAKVIQGSGEVTNKLIRDEMHKDSLIEKTKDAVSDAGTSVKQAVTGK